MSLKYVKDRILVGSMYAPFCRTKYVDMSEWENDIRTMSELGYTCLHGFAEWWRIEKQKGVFDFTEQDYLIELCHKYGIVPIINVATQNGVGYYMPRWMQNEYHGKGVIDAEGKGNPVDTEYVKACMDDPWYQMYSQRYLKALASHYAGDDRIGGWVIWGEPMLSKEGKPICYCEHTVARFRKWLEKRYGTIDKLNEIWGTEGPHDHVSFHEINPPVGAWGQRGGYASWADWQNFMCENFADHIKTADRIFKENGAMQPTISEMFCYVSNDALCNDLWTLAETSDIVGVSQYLRPGRETDIVMTVANSIARRLNKSVFIVEANGGPRYPNYDKRTPDPTEICSEAVQMLGSNAKGLMYWVWRPRLSDYEGGTFGMCRADGKPLPRVYAAGKMADQLSNLNDVLLPSRRVGEVGILYSSHTVHLAGADVLTQTVQDASLGAMKMMIDAHITPLLVSDEMLAGELPEELKVLILPFAYALNDDSAEGIRRFVERGGTVIADQHLAYKRLNGFAYRELPGGGLREVFGLERDDLIYLEHPAQLPKDNVYEIPLDTCLDILLPTKAEVVEADGERPMITKNSFGEGTAWYLAWQAFVSYQRKGGIPALRKRMLELLAEAGVVPFAHVEDRDELPFPNVSLNEQKLPDGRRILSVVNPSYEPAELTVTIAQAEKVSALVGTAAFSQEKQGDGLKITIPFAAWDSIMFMVE